MLAATLLVAVVVVGVAFFAYRQGRAHGITEAHRAMHRGQMFAGKPQLSGRNGESVTLIPVTRSGRD